MEVDFEVILAPKKSTKWRPTNFFFVIRHKAGILVLYMTVLDSSSYHSYQVDPTSDFRSQNVLDPAVGVNRVS
jgi:hypothetical protein